MLADVNLITPLRDTQAAERVRKRKQEHRKAQRVVPRRENSSALNQDTGERKVNTGISRYA